ncbi:glutathione S-transferase [Durotheca rogersii]|uniref:glutathione S-transferase n=1 Tax=Durotheca rogersii TaxID=419775 RepID=UPI00222110E4|nr:glutathione S-transferase [Durotheca rogersii]KAI5861879.1 glutathione S-transferase [Durotheca rogersii]
MNVGACSVRVGVVPRRCRAALSSPLPSAFSSAFSSSRPFPSSPTPSPLLATSRLGQGADVICGRTSGYRGIVSVSVSQKGQAFGAGLTGFFAEAYRSGLSSKKQVAMASKITDWVKPGDPSGEFKRQASTFRDWISDEPGAKFPPEKGRYHLYVSYACPWATRTLIVRKLKGLEDFISFSSVHWHMGENGWRFPTPADTDAAGENVVPDPVPGHEGYTHLRQVYLGVDPAYAGRFTVPVLFDKQTGVIVNNESSEILRMLGHAFDSQLPPEAASARALDLYPEQLRAAIDEAHAWTYDKINNGVYKSGFATTQEAYERNVTALFDALDRAEKHLAKTGGPFFFGDQITEVDVRLFPTLIRFDPVYVQHFKCNLRDIRSGYPHLHAYTRRLYWQHAAFGDTTNFLHIKNHYTRSHPQINPFSITPLGPVPDILPLDDEVPAAKAAVAAATGKAS